MVLEKHDSGVCWSPTELTSPTTVQAVSTSATATLKSTCDKVQSLSDFHSIIGDQNFSMASDSVFSHPAPDSGSSAATATDVGSSDSELTTTAPEQSENILLPPRPSSFADDSRDFTETSSAVDSGWESRGSPVSSDSRYLMTPSPQPSTPLSPSESPASCATKKDGIAQRRSFTQRLSGLFSKNPDKERKSTTNGDKRLSQEIALPNAVAHLPISEKDKKILQLMVERQEAERQQAILRSQNLVTPRRSNKGTAGTRSSGRPTSAYGIEYSSSSSVMSNGTSSVAARTTCTRPQLMAYSGQNGYSDGCSTDGSASFQTSPADSRQTSTQASPTESRRTSICSATSATIDPRLLPYDTTRAKFAQKTEKRRQSVEQRLEQQRREREEQQRQLKLKQEQDLQRANSVRLSREQQQAMRARQENEKVQQKHEMVSKQRQLSVNDLSSRREEIDARLAAAEAKVQKKKEEEIQKNKSELQKRFENSRQRQREMEAELENWQRELQKYNQWQEGNAEKAAQQATAMRIAANCKARLEKEKKQQENMKRLMTLEEKKLAEMEATIESKEARTKALQKEKEEKVLRSRNRAMAMKQVRDELRAHYSMNDLDQLARHVALENRLLSRQPDSSAQSSLMNSMTSLA